MKEALIRQSVLCQHNCRSSARTHALPGVGCPRVALLENVKKTRAVSCRTAQPIAAWSQERAVGIARALSAFYRFTRPHTIIGTALSVTSVSILALHGPGTSLNALPAFGTALVAALLANVSIVGLNQCYDVDVDKVNKPYLPLASGEWTLQTGWHVVIATGALALAVAAVSGSWPLMLTVASSIFLGFVYSADLPWLRWKRFPVAAAACILAVRAIFVQIGFWAHIRLAISSGPLVLPRLVVFMTGFMLLFSIVIALFKDIPDVRGDEMYGTSTASVRFGTERIFWTCVTIMHAAYASAALFFAASCSGWVQHVTVASQLAFGVALQVKASATDLRNHAQIVSCYMFIWKLFYSQYLVFPLAAIVC